jgi:hypothetical protein
MNRAMARPVTGARSRGRVAAGAVAGIWIRDWSEVIRDRVALYV